MMEKKMGASNTMNYAKDTDYVEVMFAKSIPEARECVGFLLEQEIPAHVENTGGAVPARGVAILVPSERMIEASELLAGRADDEEETEEVETDEEFDDLDDFDDEEDEDDDYDDEEDDDFDDDEEEEFEEEVE